MSKKIFNIVFFISLNPFLGSSLFGFETDLSLFFLTSVILFLIFRVNFLLILFLPITLIIPVKFLFYILFLIFINKIKNFPISTKILKLTIITWISLLIIEILFPELHSNLFFRNQMLFVGRGYSSFGPEPVTAGLFALCMFLCFKDNLSMLYKILIAIIILATFNFAIVLFFILLIFKNYFNFKTILITFLTTLLVVGLTNDYVIPIRLNEFIKVFSTFDLDIIINFILSDRSLSNRLIPFLSLYTDNNSLISSGIFVPFNYYGILYVIPTIYIFSKINSINKLIVLILFCVSGSPAHLMPLYLLFKPKKKQNDISINSTLQR